MKGRKERREKEKKGEKRHENSIMQSYIQIEVSQRLTEAQLRILVAFGTLQTFTSLTLSLSSLLCFLPSVTSPIFCLLDDLTPSPSSF